MDVGGMGAVKFWNWVAWRARKATSGSVAREV